MSQSPDDENKPGRTEEDKKKEEEHFTSDVKLLGSVAITGGVYAVAYGADGKTVAAAGEDGKIRIINTEDTKVTKEFVPVPLKK